MNNQTKKCSVCVLSLSCTFFPPAVSFLHHFPKKENKKRECETENENPLWMFVALPRSVFCRWVCMCAWREAKKPTETTRATQTCSQQSWIWLHHLFAMSTNLFPWISCFFFVGLRVSVCSVRAPFFSLSRCALSQLLMHSCILDVCTQKTLIERKIVTFFAISKRFRATKTCSFVHHWMHKCMDLGFRFYTQKNES